MRGIFFGFPVVALELVCIFGLALFTQPLHVVGDTRGDQESGIA